RPFPVVEPQARQAYTRKLDPRGPDARGISMGRWSRIPYSMVVPAAVLLTSIALASPQHAASPARAHVEDESRRIDANRINLFVANTGHVGYDEAAEGPGLFYPRGGPGSILYNAGLWLGGAVAGAPRVSGAYYSTDFTPGGIRGGVRDDPTR